MYCISISINMYLAFPLQVSIGTLLAFTMVAISVLILRYIPPDEVPLPPSLEDSIATMAMRYSLSNAEKNVGYAEANVGTSKDIEPLVVKEDVSINYPLIAKHLAIGNRES